MYLSGQPRASLILETGQFGELDARNPAALELIEQLLPPFWRRAHPSQHVALEQL